MKSYIDKNLQPEEKIYYKANVHWCIFVFPAILLIIGIHYYPSLNVFEHIIGIITLPVGILTLLRSLYLKIGTQYVVTNKRVILKRGLLNRNALELVLNKCEGLSFNQGILSQAVRFRHNTAYDRRCYERFSICFRPCEFQERYK